MYKVGEIAQQTGVSVDTIRYYTQKELLAPRRDPANGYQLYSVGDVQRVRFILQAKRLGYTLKEIDEIFSEARQGHSPCPRVREIIEARIGENRHRLDELHAAQTRMERALERWKSLPDGIPDGNSVCHLIETDLE